MSISNPKSELSLFETIDIRAFFETLRLRWWVIPVVLAASVGFLQAQESDLRTEPVSVFVSRGYEIGTPQRLLGGVGINILLTETPEAITQLLILKSEATAQEIATEIGKEVEVKVPDDWESPMTFTCNEPLAEDCEVAIDAYVNKAAEIRKDAIRRGIASAVSVLSDSLAINPDPIGSSRLATLRAIEADFEITVTLVDGFEEEMGPTVSEVRRPTYLMGLAAGLLISLLILLQLTYSDSRIRSVRQLVRVVGSDSYLGRASKKINAVRDRRTAITLHQGLLSASATHLRYLPLRTQLNTDAESTLTRLTSMIGASRVVSMPFAELEITEISNPVASEADVIIVQRNRDLRKDVVEALSALQRSSRKLVGVLLVD